MTLEFLKALRTYLASTLGLAVPALKPWPGAKALPRYLADGFSFHVLDLWGRTCLLMVAKQEVPSPVDLQRQLRLVERQAGLPVLYGQTEMIARQRQRLLELFVPFVVPGRQLFLPPLGVDLREQYVAQARHHAPALGPAAQAVLLAGLLGYWGEESHAAAMARRFGYSAMTLTRARRELLDRGLVGAQGERRWALNGTREAAWLAAQPVLRSPVLRRVWCNLPMAELEWLPKAGLSALAEYSMLSAPAVPAVALSEAARRSLLDRLPSLHQADEVFEGAVEVEVWSYDPHILIESTARCVDRYSLFMSLQAEAATDERVALALDEMMRGVAG